MSLTLRAARRLVAVRVMVAVALATPTVAVLPYAAQARAAGRAAWGGHLGEAGQPTVPPVGDALDYRSAAVDQTRSPATSNSGCPAPPLRAAAPTTALRAKFGPAGTKEDAVFQLALDLAQLNKDDNSGLSDALSALADVKSLPDFLHDIVAMVSGLEDSPGALGKLAAQVGTEVAELAGVGACVTLLGKIVKAVSGSPAPSPARGPPPQRLAPSQQGLVGIIPGSGLVQDHVPGP